MPDTSWLPSATQPVAPFSKLELAIRLLPPDRKTSTSSTRHSPSSCKNIWSESGVPVPLSRTPVVSTKVQELFADSSLSAQLPARQGSPRGSINSRLLPPPLAQCGQRPPVCQATSATATDTRLEVAIWLALVALSHSGLDNTRRSPPFARVPP